MLAAIVVLVSIPGTSGTAMAGGAGGGSFGCTMTGVPGWGTVRSSYHHRYSGHYATAVGRGRWTVWAAPNHWAVAKVSRATYGNRCYWGKSW